MGCIAHDPCAMPRTAIDRWLGRLPERLEAASLEGNLAACVGESKRFGGQASKSIRWMPWHQEAMKDVVKLR